MESLSLGNSKTMYGIKIKKLPIGKYLELSKKINGLVKEIFNNKYLEEIDFSSITKEEFLQLVEQLFINAPNLLINFIADIVEVDENKLINNEEIGLYELIEIIESFIEVNNLGKLGKKIKQVLKIVTQNIGYKN